MNDWKEVVKKGPAYEGPDDITLKHVITSFGYHRGCLRSYLKKHVGDNPYWPETLDQKLKRLESEGRVILSERLNDTYIEMIN